MKTTWTLEFKSTKATRDARAFRRELQSLQGMLENVDGASARLNATLGRMSAPAMVQRRVRGERAVAREVRAQSAGHRRVAQDIATQGRVRKAVEAVQRQGATRTARDQQQRAARSDRAWRRELQHVNRVAHAEMRRDRQAVAGNVRASRAAMVSQPYRYGAGTSELIPSYMDDFATMQGGVA